jgi:hypothetical protein
MRVGGAMSCVTLRAAAWRSAFERNRFKSHNAIGCQLPFRFSQVFSRKSFSDNAPPHAKKSSAAALLSKPGISERFSSGRRPPIELHGVKLPPLLGREHGR